jgi:hypothetical protein
MLLVFANRHEMVELVEPKSITNMVELGVYEGEFAEHCYNVLRPQRYTLIDFWNYDQYAFVLEDAPQMRELRAVYSRYFHDDPQAALEAAYQKTRDRFENAPNVETLRMDIAKAPERFPNGSLDFIYLDGNHTYEFVLRDLSLWYAKLRPGGLFVLNDFFESRQGARQNLGVIPAFLTFSKRYPTYPLALTATDWSDLYFSNVSSSLLITGFRDKILGSRYHVIDLPQEVLANYRHDLIERPNQPDRLLPTFACRSGS